jgi:hypothetical protein
MAGYRTWTDSDRLDADGVNNYLMSQCVPRFASTDERDAQMGGIVAGQLSYVLGLGLQIYTTAAVWATLAGDIGQPLTFRGTWSSSVAYPAGSLVKKSGAGYVAVATTTAGDDPTSGTTSGNWTSLL